MILASPGRTLLLLFFLSKSEYDQEIPQSHTTEKPMALIIIIPNDVLIVMRS